MIAESLAPVSFGLLMRKAETLVLRKRQALVQTKQDAVSGLFLRASTVLPLRYGVVEDRVLLLVAVLATVDLLVLLAVTPLRPSL
jgi:hypothetical protein